MPLQNGGWWMSLNQMFSKPRAGLHTLRVLVYGPPKTGKTHFVHSAVEVGPLYVFDTEKGFDFYTGEFLVAETDDPRKILAAIQAAKKGTEGIPIIAVDSATSVWEAQKEVADQLTARWKRVGDVDRATFRAWAPAKKPLKDLYRAMHTAQCHIIFSARAKRLFDVAPGGEPVERGLGPDVESNLEYAVDLVLLAGVNPVPRPKASDYWVRVVGGRSRLEIGTVIPDPTFAQVLAAAVPSSCLSGEPPATIESSVADQVAEGEADFQTWGEMEAAINNAGWNIDEVKALLRDNFGPFKLSKMAEYWLFLKGTYASHSQ